MVDLLVATGKIKGHDGAKEYARMRITSMAIGNASLDDEEVVEELITDGQLVDTHDYAEEILNTMSRQVIEQALDTLSVREAEVLRLRFGFYDGIPKTLEEVGKVFNLSRDRIRQIENKAIRRLRHPSRSKDLKELDFETQKYGR